MPVALVVIGLAILAVAVLPKLQAEKMKSDKAGECRALQIQLAQARQQGGDAQQIARLESAIRLCVEDAKAVGVNIDSSAIDLQIARDAAQQIAAEWSHYRSTDDTDAVKRNSTINTILRAADTMVANLRAAVANATTQESLNAIQGFVIEQARASFDRAQCFDTTGAGCSRYGVNERPWHERIRDEWTRVLLPLIGVGPDVPNERRNIFARVRPLWERFGVPVDFSPRVARRGPDYGGIVTGDVARLRGAGSNSVFDAVEERRRALFTPRIDISAALKSGALLDPKYGRIIIR